MKVTPTHVLIRQEHLVIGLAIEGKQGAWLRFNLVRLPLTWFSDEQMELVARNRHRIIAREQQESDVPMF